MTLGTGPAVVLALVVAGVAVAALVLLGRWRHVCRHRHALQQRLAASEERLALAGDVDGVRNSLARQERLATLGFLLAGIAHELNTPVAAVDASCDTIRRTHDKLVDLLGETSLSGEELARARRLADALLACDDVVANGLGRMRELIRSLRTAARGDSPEPEPYDVNAGIESALLLLHNELKHDISVETDLGELPPIRAIPAQINQVVLNLLLNARQAIAGRGRIRITTRHEGDDVVIEVTDSGMGIPAENLERIFAPDFTTKPLNEGTGLGLALSRSVCRCHGGDVTVASRGGDGTTFTVRLPLVPPETAGPATTGGGG
jgi:signal transduction histidine kinase